MTRFARFFPLLPALCLAACSGTGGDKSSALPESSPDPVASNKIKTGDWFDDDRDKIAAKYGDFNPKMTKDGQVVEGAGKEFAGFKRDNPEFKGRWADKEYKGEEFKKKSWWGDKDYVKKVYEGDTDANSLKKDSRFSRSKANESSMAARDSGKTYETDAYATGRAREEGNDKISKTSDAETDGRRKVFTDPDVIPWQAQNGMTVEETNRLMGR